MMLQGGFNADWPAIDYLQKHESFADMLAIIMTNLNPRDTAHRLLELLIRLLKREFVFKSKHPLEARRIASCSMGVSNLEPLQFDADALAKTVALIQEHRAALCDFLIYHGRYAYVANDPMFWKVGDPILTPPLVPCTENFPTAAPVVPSQYRCPISGNLMNDSVVAKDGFTYERKSIVRWFRIRRASPTTGDALASNALRPVAELKHEIKVWVRAQDIRDRHTGASDCCSVDLFLTKRSTVSVPTTLTIAELYEVAFRATKARQWPLHLYQGNTRLEPTSLQLSSLMLRDQTNVSVLPADRTTASSHQGHSSLIKVYKEFDFLLSYWEPENTNKTMASVIFRTLRMQYESLHANQLNLWSQLTRTNDGNSSGRLHHHWEMLSNYLTPGLAEGNLEPESLYDSDVPISDDDELIPDDDELNTDDDELIDDDDELIFDDYDQTSDDETSLEKESASNNDKESASNNDKKEPASNNDKKEPASNNDKKDSASNDDTCPAFDPFGADLLVLKLCVFVSQIKEDHLNRLAVVKQGFDAFVNRLLAYDFRTRLGKLYFPQWLP